MTLDEIQHRLEEGSSVFLTDIDSAYGREALALAERALALRQIINAKNDLRLREFGLAALRKASEGT